MNKTLQTLLLIVTVSFAGQEAFAAGINKRQANQARRIGQGVHSGQLTARETGKLVRQQRRIALTERRFKSDGHFTIKDRARVQHQLNHASAQIFKQKHDGQHR